MTAATASTIAGGVVGLVLATSAFGSGGRAADVLFVHQALTCVAMVGLLTIRPALARRRGAAALLVLLFALFAFLVTPYRYGTLLQLADVWTAAFVYFLSSVASTTTVGRRLVLGGFVCGVVVNLLEATVERLLGGLLWGLFENPHHGASLVAAAAVLFLLVPLPLRDRYGTALRLAVLGIAVGFIVALTSRGGALALFVGLFAAALLSQRRSYLLLVPLLLIAIVAIPSPLSSRLWEGSRIDRYSFERVRIWIGAAKMGWRHASVGGVGLGSFRSVARRYNFPVEGALGRYGKFPNTAHSDYLSLWAEASVPGLALLLVPCVVTVRRVWPHRASACDSAAEQRAALAGASAILAHGAVEVVLQSPAVLYSLATLLAVAAGSASAVVDVTTPGVALSRSRLRVTVWVIAAMWGHGSLLPWLGHRAYVRFERTDDVSQLERAIWFVPGHAGYQARAGDVWAQRFQTDGRASSLARASWHYRESTRLDRQESTSWARWARFEHGVFQSIPGGGAEELAQRADEHYREASLRDPFNPFLLHDRGLLLAALGRLEEASLMADAAVELESNYYLGWMLEARLARALGDREAEMQAEHEMLRIEELAQVAAPSGPYERGLLASAPGS